MTMRLRRRRRLTMLAATTVAGRHAGVSLSSDVAIITYSPDNSPDEATRTWLARPLCSSDTYVQCVHRIKPNTF